MYLWITNVKTQNRRVANQRKTLYNPKSWESIF